MWYLTDAIPMTMGYTMLPVSLEDHPLIHKRDILVQLSLVPELLYWCAVLQNR